MTEFGGVQTTPEPNTSAKNIAIQFGSRIVIQIGGVYPTFCREEGILLQKYRDRNGRCIAILFKSIGSGVDVTLLNVSGHRTWAPDTLSQSFRVKWRRVAECMLGALFSGPYFFHCLLALLLRGSGACSCC